MMNSVTDVLRRHTIYTNFQKHIAPSCRSESRTYFLISVDASRLVLAGMSFLSWG